jgi:two-component system OmpR family response regulator
MRILVVEDDVDLATAVRETLVDGGHAVDVATTGTEGEELAAVHDYDLVVLDWSLPPPSGIELLRAWRARGLATPVLMLTGRGALADRVHGLDAGADDYLAKPFALVELAARARSLLRRRERPLASLAAGDLVLDPARREVTVAGTPVRLTPKEYGVLAYLLAHRDRPVGREELAEHVWDRSFDALSNTLDVIVYRLRKKIDGTRPERLLHTVTGVGYLLASQRRAAVTAVGAVAAVGADTEGPGEAAAGRPPSAR